MTGEEALKAYGFAEVSPGFYQRVFGGHVAPTQSWRRVPEGWLRFDPPGKDHWGRLDPGGSGWMQVPYSLNERGEGVGGLHPARHEEMFEWVWPDVVVAFQYRYAESGWRKQDDGTMVREQ